MVDALLINPSLFKREGNIWKRVDSCFPSLGLASVAAYARSRGFRVKIIDAPAFGISVESFENFLREKYYDLGPRYVGFTATTSSVKNAYAMAKIIRRVYPEVKIVFGGVHATVLPQEVISNDEIDFVVRGEGEITFCEILSDRNPFGIDGLVYKQDGRVVINRCRSRINNLDSLPFPAYDLLPMDKYYPAKGSYERLPAMSMMTSRGCPGRCTFCNKTLGETMFFRSADSLIEEIKLLIMDYGIRQIMFYDDTFTVHKENVRKFCQLLLAQNIDVAWCCFSRVDYVDLDLLKLMKKSGCHQIMYGIESGVQEVLDSIDKKINLETVRKIVKLTKEAQIDVRGAFMIGSPIETRKMILKTLNFAIELNPELAIFNITTPYPGTVMFQQAKNKNTILTYDWDDYDLSKPVMKLEHLNSEEIMRLYRYCYWKFYFRLSYFFMRLKRLIKKPAELKLIWDSMRGVSFFLKSQMLTISRQMFQYRSTNNNVTRGNGLLENFLSKKRSQLVNKFIPEHLRQGKILDIGCGTTPFFLITTRFKEKYGFNSSLKNCHDADGINLKEFEIKSNGLLPFADNFFDVVTMLAVFEHIEPSALVNLLIEIKRILKPKGRFIITTPTPLGNKFLLVMTWCKLVSSEEIREHKGAYCGEQIADYLVEVGFDKKNMVYGRFEFFLNNWFYVDK